MPELYEGPPPGQGGKGVEGRPDPAVQFKKKPGPQIPTPTHDDAVADATHINGQRMLQAFESVKSNNAIYHMPDTLTWTAGVQNDPVTTAWADEALEFVAGYTGGDNLAGFLSAELLGDPVVKENTIAVLNEITGSTYGSIGRVGSIPGVAGVREYTDDELIEVVMRGGMAVLDNLKPGDKAALGGIADDLLASLQNAGEPGEFTQDYQRMIEIGKTGDLSIAMSQDQIALMGQVQEAFGRLGGLRQTAETPELAGIGIEQVRQLGPGGVVVLNSDWAQAHPDEAFAVKVGLEADNPEVTIEWDREGAWGSLLNKFGQVVDHVSAPFGGAIQQANELGERAMNSPEDRAAAGKAADAIEQGLSDGSIPDDKIEEAQRAVASLRDSATDDVGWDEYKDQVFRNANPQAIGMGFADSASKASGILPGDPGYGLFYGSMAIVSNIAFDPTTYITAGLAGLRHARLAPVFEHTVEAVEDAVKGLRAANPALDEAQLLAAATRQLTYSRTAEISKSWLRNWTNAKLAKGPEEIMVTKPYMQAADELWAMKQAMGEKRFASFLAQYQTDPWQTSRFLRLGRRAHGLGGDTETAKFIAGARSQDDLRWSLVRVQAGQAAELPDIARFEERLTDVTRQLDEVTYPPGTLFHGTKADIQGIEQADVLQYGNREALMGPGLYLTDDASVAGSYASRKGVGAAGKAHPAAIDPNLNLLNADAVLPDEIAQVFENHIRAQGDLLDIAEDTDLTFRGKTGAEAVKHYKRILGDAEIPVSEGAEIMDGLIYNLEQAGYHGWSYRGGLRTGGKEHNVTVLFDTGDVPLAERVRSVEGVGLAAGPVKDGLIAEQAWLRSAIDGTDWLRPMRQTFSSKQIRKLKNLAKKELDRHDQVWAEATQSVEQTPTDILVAGGETLTKHVAEHPEVVKQSRTLMQKWHDRWTHTGFGEQIVLPGVSGEAKALRRGKLGVEDVMTRLKQANPKLRDIDARAAARQIVADQRTLADATEEGFAHMTNMGRALGISDARVQQLMEPWVAGELGTPAKNYQWLVGTKEEPGVWSQMIEESPRIRQSDKVELKQMWKENYLSDRAASTIQGPGVADDVEPGWFQTTDAIDTATGAKVGKKAVPMLEADQLQVWRAPSLDHMNDYLSKTRRTMRDWRATGGWGKRAISTSHLGITQGFQAFTNFWKTAVLATRVTALPARIVSEEMLRMAALDYSSMVWHPIEWFQSTGLGTKAFPYSDFALQGDVPTHALGAAVRQVADNPSMRLARQGRETVKLSGQGDEVLAYFRSLSDRIGRTYASPSSHSYIPFLDNPEAALAHISKQEWADSWKATVAGTSHTELEAVERAQQVMRQTIGEGPGAEYIKVALSRGKVVIDGEEYTAGTVQFAQKMHELYDRGDWVPGTTALSRSAGDYLPASKMQILHEFRDGVFNVIYSAPDLALARSNLWRQMAAREYRNLIRRGYSSENAMVRARAFAARGTADMMFTIGAKTRGEYFLRNLMPFFPATRELSDTWLLRAPLRMGSGTWSLGALTVARRADVWIDFFKNTGVLQENENGELQIPLPFMEGIVGAFTGLRGPFVVSSPASSAAGVLPDPSTLFRTEDEDGNPIPLVDRLKGVLPSLGGTSAAVLNALNNIPGMKGSLDLFEDLFTLYGADASLGPASVDNFLEAFGIEGPWMTSMSAHGLENMRTSAVADGMNLAWSENPPKDWKTYDLDDDGYLTGDEAKAYAAQNPAELQAWVEKGERYATGLYMMKGFSSMLLPFSVSVSNENKEQMNAMWDLLNALPEDGSFASSFISSTLAENPDLGPYMTGKTIDLRPGIVDDIQSAADFFEQVDDGKRIYRNPMDRAVFAAGMNSYANYQMRLDGIYEDAGTPTSTLQPTRHPTDLGVSESGGRPISLYVEYDAGDSYVRAAVKRWNRQLGFTALEVVDSPEGADFPVVSDDNWRGKAPHGDTAGAWVSGSVFLAREMFDSAPDDESGEPIPIRNTNQFRVVMHELGHTLGLQDTYDAAGPQRDQGVMSDIFDKPSAREIQAIQKLFGVEAVEGPPAYPTPAQWLLNFDARDEATQEKIEWQHFLDLSHDFDRSTGQTMSFEEMWQQYNEFRSRQGGDSEQLSLEQQRLLEFSGMMREYAIKLDPNQQSSDDFYKLQDEAYSALGDSTTTIGKGVNWWFSEVADPYYEKLDKMYSKLDETEDRDKPAVYQDIRHLTNKYNHTFTNDSHPAWGKFPSPEEYIWSKKTEGEQRRQLADWANLPGDFLTAFQREQVGYSIPKGKQDAADTLVDYMAKGKRLLDEYVEKNQTSYASLDVIAKQKKLEQAYAERAKKLGVEQFYKELNAPDYRRIDKALGLSEKSPVWKTVARYADMLARAAEARDFSIGGTTSDAKLIHTWFAGAIRKMRGDNAEFDSIMTDLSYALGEDGNPLAPDDLVLKLFFDVFDTSKSYYLPSDEGIATRGPAKGYEVFNEEEK